MHRTGRTRRPNWPELELIDVDATTDLEWVDRRRKSFAEREQPYRGNVRSLVRDNERAAFSRGESADKVISVVLMFDAREEAQGNSPRRLPRRE